MSLVSEHLRPFWRRFAASEFNHLQLLLILLGFSLAYFLAAKLGIATSLPPQGIVILWPPNAIVLIVLLRLRRDQWWLVFVVTVTTEIGADVPAYPLWAAAGYGIVNFSEAALAAVLLTRFTRDGPLLLRLRDFLVFVAVGPLLASGTAALFGAAIYEIGAPDVDYFHYWLVFWLGDALGLLIVGTALLAWTRPGPWLRRSMSYAAVEGTVLLTGLLTASLWAFLTDRETPSVYLVFPFLVWAALRFGVRGASLAIAATVTIAIGSAIAGLGPFAAISGIDTVMSLQGLIAVVALSTFMLAFSTEDLLRTTDQLQKKVQEHRATEKELRGAYGELERINRDLDRIVAERTSDLRRTVAYNEMLLREVHHRVKNNLQLVVSLVGLHSRSVSSPMLRRKFAEVQGQIAAIAVTHDILQQMKTIEVVDFSLVVPELCRNIDGAFGEGVTLSIETGAGAFVSAESAVALSLALNELITNSIKHASGATAAISVTCRCKGDSVVVTIADDGPGFPPDFDFDRPKGFGLRMAHDVVKRAGGHLRFAPTNRGADVEISVPKAPEPE